MTSVTTSKKRPQLASSCFVVTKARRSDSSSRLVSFASNAGNELCAFFPRAWVVGCDDDSTAAILSRVEDATRGLVCSGDGRSVGEPEDVSGGKQARC
jgi:hypothetical protein